MSLSQNNNRKSLIVIIPAFNEALTIEKVVKSIKSIVNSDVVVINDNSTDNTAKIAQAAGAMVLSHTLRTGAWGAIRTGLRYAVKKGYDIAVTMDADGQHTPDFIQKIVGPIQSKQADIVIGSCPFRASLPKKLAWTFFRKFTMLGIKDLTSGFRAYNRKVIISLISINTILLDYQDIGVLLYLKKEKFKIIEKSIEMRSRIAGHSKIFSSWFAILKYIILTGILCFSKLK